VDQAAKSKISGALLLGLLALAWFTLEPGRIRLVAMLILTMFLVRIVLHATRARYDEGTREEDEEA
jgi:hypothetical protein